MVERGGWLEPNEPEPPGQVEASTSGNLRVGEGGGTAGRKNK